MKKEAQVAHFPFNFEEPKAVNFDSKPLQSFLEDVISGVKQEHNEPQEENTEEPLEDMENEEVVLDESDGENVEQTVPIEMETEDTQFSGDMEVTNVSIEDGEAVADVSFDGEITFKLDKVPGAETQDDIEDEPEPEKVVEEKKEYDDWDWEGRGVNQFLQWLQDRLGGVPKHSGYDTTGLERALAYFDRLNTEITRAMRKDYRNEIDAAKAEQAREEIEKGIERLIERLDRLKSKKFNKGKKNKKAEEVAPGIVKTAETSFPGEMSINIPYFISFIARTCIESVVQAGKDLNEMFIKLSKDYDLDKREKAQVICLFKDMGYPLIIDRGQLDKKDIDVAGGEGEKNKTYFA